MVSFHLLFARLLAWRRVLLMGFLTSPAVMLFGALSSWDSRLFLLMYMILSVWVEQILFYHREQRTG